MAVGLLSLSIALCFAEVGSRFETTGGPYLPARAAFGRFVGFEVGWMMWFARVTSHASVVNGLTLALAFYWPALADGIPRAATITGADARADVDQRPRHQAVVVGRQRADDRQAPAAGDLHHRRHLVHRSVALREHAGGQPRAGVRRGDPVDLRLRRLRSDRRAGRRSGQSAQGRAVRVRRVPDHRVDRDVADVARRDRRAAGCGGHAHAARRWRARSFSAPAARR